MNTLKLVPKSPVITSHILRQSIDCRLIITTGPVKEPWRIGENWSYESAKKYDVAKIKDSTEKPCGYGHSLCVNRADSRFAPSQWETALLCNDVSHWLGANLESALQKRSILVPKCHTEILTTAYWYQGNGQGYYGTDLVVWINPLWSGDVKPYSKS